MRFVEPILQSVVRPPQESVIEGRTIASFNKIQCWAYPNICKEQMDKALSFCDPKTQQRQRRIANLFLRNIF